MSARTFFIVLIKLAGLYILKEAITTFLELASFTIYDLRNSLDVSYLVIIIWIFKLFLILFASYFFIFHTEKLITILKVSDFTEDTSLSFEKEKVNTHYVDIRFILHVSIIVMGGVILIKEIPNFFNHLNTLMHGEVGINAPVIIKKGDLIVTVINILIGLLLLGERNRIVSIILEKSKNNSIEVKEEAD